MKKSIFSVILTVFVWMIAALSVTAVFAVTAWFQVTKPVAKDDTTSVRVEIPSGTSVKDAAKTLMDNGLIRSDRIFYYIARFGVFSPNRNFTLKSGVYNFSKSMPLESIYRMLEEGAQELVKVSIPEGLTKTKIARIMEDNGVCSSDDFLKSCVSKDLLEKYRIPAENFEGYLFPDTYFLAKDMSADEVLCLLADNFFGKAASVKNLAGLPPEELHKKVILASVVEREYRDKDEAPLIASVFTNRLKNSIGLYSCATIEYIITEINGLPHPNRITYKDLKIDSDYNTYKYAGLPHGPISNPGLIAIDASANPAETKYFYFVLTDKQNGRHTFSVTFDQHKVADPNNYVSK